MTEMTLTFDAVSEATPGPKWAARWARSWPAYEPWFIARGGDNGPDRTTCRDAIADHMPELLGTYDRLVDLVGLCGYYTLISMTLNAFEVPLPDGAAVELTAR